jgi:phosphoribosyl-ATP pyrophosphohydrolase/phosphoribosyl-AMP cyclohydrolase
MSEVAFDAREDGLIPAVIQDRDGGAVLMVGYVNRESLARTLETGEVHFFSRSRQRLWKKGETSGNVLKLREIRVDCDGDCLLIRAEPTGPVCHTGAQSCFFSVLDSGDSPGELPASLSEELGRLARTIRQRRAEKPEGSYTARLFEAGVDRIAQKVGEEAVELVIAAKNEAPERIAEESADLLYHLLVLWQSLGVSTDAIAGVLAKRRGGEAHE